MKFVFSNIIGCFVVDEDKGIVEERLFDKEVLDKINNLKSYSDINRFLSQKEDEVIKEYNNKNIEVSKLLDLDDKKLRNRILRRILLECNDKAFFDLSRNLLFKVTAEELKSINPDKIIIQNMETLEQLTKTLNILMKRIREYLVVKNPKLNKEVKDDDLLLDILIGNKQNKQVLREYKEHPLITRMDDRDETLFKELVLLADSTRKGINRVKEVLTDEVNALMPETSKVATPLLAAKLLMLAGSFKKLATSTSSFIQLLGAEKALFRHLRSGAKPPKYGVLYQHPDVVKASIKEKGKVARKLASRISIALRKDYFRRDALP